MIVCLCVVLTELRMLGTGNWTRVCCKSTLNLRSFYFILWYFVHVYNTPWLLSPCLLSSSSHHCPLSSPSPFPSFRTFCFVCNLLMLTRVVCVHRFRNTCWCVVRSWLGPQLKTACSSAAKGRERPGVPPQFMVGFGRPAQASAAAVMILFVRAWAQRFGINVLLFRADNSAVFSLSTLSSQESLHPSLFLCRE